jgi:hypothetical protein
MEITIKAKTVRSAATLLGPRSHVLGTSQWRYTGAKKGEEPIDLNLDDMTVEDLKHLQTAMRENEEAGVRSVSKLINSLDDPAIKSRCIAEITYGIPDEDERTKLWAVLSAEFNLPMTERDCKRASLLFPQTVGRDIQNLLRLTHRVCKALGEEFSLKAIADLHELYAGGQWHLHDPTLATGLRLRHLFRGCRAPPQSPSGGSCGRR